MPPSPPSVVTDLSDGRDELNLAEFPIASLSERLPPGMKTLSFTDVIRDHGTGTEVTRKLTISASDAHGLPCALDDEVILGLIQLTKQTNNFTEPTVFFSRYELIVLLGWPLIGRSYRRLEESLNRWVGVTLYYDSAWWDKGEQSWVDEKFHILERVSLYDREKKPRKGTPPRKSSFTWNQVVFRSFQAENLKRLDLQLYLSLKHAASKRMFRFLDKRFYRSPKWTFDLQVFGKEHVGLSQNYHTGELKRRLRGAIAELEEAGILAPLPESERFLQVRRGVWQIVLIKSGASKEGTPAPAPAIPVVASPVGGENGAAELAKRGVTLVVAQKLAAAVPAARIQEKIAVFDWLCARKDKRVSRSPAGFLVKSIELDYTAPPGYLPPAQQQAREEQASQQRQQQAERVRQTEAEAEAKRQQDRSPLEAFWQACTPEERERITLEAQATAEPWSRTRYESAKAAGSPTAEIYLRLMVDKHLKRLLAQVAQGVPVSATTVHNS